MAKKKVTGNKHIIVRGNPDLHAKVQRVMTATGADKSVIVRSVLNWMSEEQIATIIGQRGQQQTAAHHGQS